jgi:hypothetical protein
MKTNNKGAQSTNKDGITRKEAIKKMAKYAALTSIGTLIILNPMKSQAQSVPDDPGGGFFD